MQRPTTAEDIAQLAGVHRGTVIDTLSATRKRRVHPNTRQRILDIATTLGYDPNAARGWRPDYGPHRSLPFADLRNRYPAHNDSQLAAELGVARRTIQRWHRSNRVAWHTAERIADHLGLYPTEIWGPAYWDLFDLDNEAAA